MDRSEGWNQVIKFDSLKPIRQEELSPIQRAEHAASSFANEIIDVFNNNPLSVRLTCLAKLSAMVGMLGMAAIAASKHRLPYVEPNRFSVDEKGKRLPLIHFTEEMPDGGK